MSKVLIILVLVSIFFSEVGYVVYYGCQQYVIKKEIKKQLIAGIDNRFLETIEFDKNKKAIIWEEEGKEFFLEGNMYDIVRTSKIKGKTYFHCLNDKKESSLKKKINTLARQGSSKPASERNKHLVKLKLTDYLLASTDTNIIASRIIQKNFFGFDEIPLFIAYEIVSPPPRA